MFVRMLYFDPGFMGWVFKFIVLFVAFSKNISPSAERGMKTEERKEGGWRKRRRRSDDAYVNPRREAAGIGRCFVLAGKTSRLSSRGGQRVSWKWKERRKWVENVTVCKLIFEIYCLDPRSNFFESVRTRKYCLRFWCAYHSSRTISPSPTSLRNRLKITVQILAWKKWVN